MILNMILSTGVRILSEKYSPEPVEVDIYAYVYYRQPDIVAIDHLKDELEGEWSSDDLRDVARRSKLLITTGSGGWIGIVNSASLDYKDALGRYRYVYPFSKECDRCEEVIPAKGKAYRVKKWEGYLYCADCYSLKVVADV